MGRLRSQKNEKSVMKALPEDGERNSNIPEKFWRCYKRGKTLPRYSVKEISFFLNGGNFEVLAGELVSLTSLLGV
ncbi:hypothetical protein JTE90_026142 [Oedothorax gibbosus]|uniref:Uncharacterized protein n=1 Tax=Oedothorax gibbosus TaxID=931172 RepID=A0AAV6V2K1_9ARAC|nr:hypothetical protein JTE90_026142 [Oedothorax gibbosus]